MLIAPLSNSNFSASDAHSSIRSITVAIFLAGFATFSLLYCVQPLIGEFARDFALTTSVAGWVLSITLLCLSIMLIPIGVLSDRIGRKSILVIALGAASLFTLLSSLVHSFHAVLLLRGLVGCALAGVPGITLAYLAEEVPADRLGRSIGLYVAGNAIGGVSGRLISSVIDSWSSWHTSVFAIGVIGISISALLWRSLPTPRHFKPLQLSARDTLRPLLDHCANPELRRYFGMGFILLGSFIAVYSYLQFYLGAPPYNIKPALTSSAFLLFLIGPPLSTWAGRYIDRRGPYRLFGGGCFLLSAGLLAMLSSNLIVWGIGLALFSAGYFVAYSGTSGSVTRRAPYAKASAAALYLCCFYGGGAIVNAFCGWAWTVAQWHGVIFTLLFLTGIFFILWLRTPALETPVAQR